MDDESRIRITERSLELGESTIPTGSEDFASWIARRLSESDGAETAEVELRFSEEQPVDDVLAFLEGVDASDEIQADLSEVTLVIRPAEG